MNENSTHTELLIQYIDGELQGKELDAVQRNIEENPAIREEMENLRLAREATRSYGLKTRIRSIHTEMMQELKEKANTKQGITRMIFQYGIRVAAVLIVMIGLSAIYQYLTVTPEKLFIENFHAFELHETRSAAGSGLEEAYKKENMQTVIGLFDQLKSPQAEDYFLAGNAFLSSHEPAKAIESFLALQQINKTANTHYFEEDEEYFLALSYLANLEPTKALPLFEKIHSDSNHPYHQKVSAWFVSKVKKLIAK
jgi:tetratricopeptide (TPR) repeat protein